MAAPDLILAARCAVAGNWTTTRVSPQVHRREPPPSTGSAPTALKRNQADVPSSRSSMSCRHVIRDGFVRAHLCSTSRRQSGVLGQQQRRSPGRQPLTRRLDPPQARGAGGVDAQAWPGISTVMGVGPTPMAGLWRQQALAIDPPMAQLSPSGNEDMRSATAFSIRPAISGNSSAMVRKSHTIIHATPQRV
jgi:hypothetical protein